MQNKFIKYILFAVLIIVLINCQNQDKKNQKQTNRKRGPSIPDPHVTQEEIEATREAMRNRERERVQKQRKKVKGSTQPKGSEHWNKHRDIDDGIGINKPNNNKSKSQLEKEKKISDDLRKGMNLDQYNLDQRKQARQKRKELRDKQMEDIRKIQHQLHENNIQETNEEQEKREQLIKQIMDEEIKDLEEQNEDEHKMASENIQKIKQESQQFKENSEKWLSEWEKNMADFQADETLTFEIEGRQQEVFLEDVSQHCNIRGAYFMSYQQKDGIEFYIQSPKGRRIFSLLDRQGIFSINIGPQDEKGTYQFVFSNKRFSEKKSIQFAIDISKSEQQAPIEVQSLEGVAQGINLKIRDIYTQFKFEFTKLQSSIMNQKSIHDKTFWFSIIETLIIISCTSLQVYYIKKMLDNRSII